MCRPCGPRDYIPGVQFEKIVLDHHCGTYLAFLQEPGWFYLLRTLLPDNNFKPHRTVSVSCSEYSAISYAPKESQAPWCAVRVCYDLTQDFVALPMHQPCSTRLISNHTLSFPSSSTSHPSLSSCFLCLSLENCYSYVSMSSSSIVSFIKWFSFVTGLG